MKRKKKEGVEKEKREQTVVARRLPSPRSHPLSAWPEIALCLLVNVLEVFVTVLGMAS
jgi:hypothetical protein